MLRQVSIFRELPAEVLADLAARVRPRAAEAGSVIVSAEEPGDSLFVIARGRVKVVLYGETGREIILSLLHAGDFFGEMSLLDNEPRSATVIAMETLDLVTIWRSDFLQILSENFSITKKILAELSKRLRSASNRIESLATMDVYGRLARFFLDLARQNGKVLENGYVAVQRPTHQSIANMIGTSRETVSRLIHDLMRQNLLLSEGKTIYFKKSALDQFRAEM